MTSSQKDKETAPGVSEWMNQQVETGRGVSLSVVVPAYNEERRLPPTLVDMIDHLERSGLTYEIIVVDDGSRDRTPEVVRKFERMRAQVRLIQLPRNYGKGHAVRLGVLNAHGKRILFADADGATPFAELDRLMTAMDSGSDVVIGSRARASTDTKVETVIHRKVLGRVFNFFVNRIVLPGIDDTQCGFKLFSRSAALFLFKHQRADRFSFDVEILYLADRAGLTIAEIPVNWTNIPGSKVRLIADSLKMFRDIIGFRIAHRTISPADYAAFQAGTE